MNAETCCCCCCKSQTDVDLNPRLLNVNLAWHKNMLLLTMVLYFHLRKFLPCLSLSSRVSLATSGKLTALVKLRSLDIERHLNLCESITIVPISDFH